MEDVRLVVGGQLLTLKYSCFPIVSFSFFTIHRPGLIEFSSLKKYQACCIESVSDFFSSLYMLMLPNSARGFFSEYVSHCAC